MLVWNETDITECLETIPEVEEYGIWHRYEVKKDGLVLEITIHQYDGDVQIELFREGVDRRIFAVNIINCPGGFRAAVCSDEDDGVVRDGEQLVAL